MPAPRPNPNILCCAGGVLHSPSLVTQFPVISTAQKFATNTVTGEFREVTILQNLNNGLTEYYSDSVLTSILPDEVVRDYVEPVPLGSEALTVTAGTAQTLAPPSEARYAYMNVNGAQAMYAFGVSPDPAVDHRVADGGRIRIESRDRLLSFQIDSLDGVTGFSARVYYYNTNPDADRT